MKNPKFSRCAYGLISFAMLLCAAGCGENIEIPSSHEQSAQNETSATIDAQSSDPSSVELPPQSESSTEQSQSPATSSGTDSTALVSSDGSSNEEPQANEEWQSSLEAFRQSMSDTTYLFAGAYLGTSDTITEGYMEEYLYTNYPELVENMPFLRGIPQDRIIGTNGELYCVIPRDKNSTIEIIALGEDENYDIVEMEQRYYTNSGEPLLVFCNSGGFAPDVKIVITDSNGNTATWCPSYIFGWISNIPFDEEGNLLMYNFTVYPEGAG